MKHDVSSGLYSVRKIPVDGYPDVILGTAGPARIADSAYRYGTVSSAKYSLAALNISDVVHSKVTGAINTSTNAVYVEYKGDKEYKLLYDPDVKTAKFEPLPSPVTITKMVSMALTIAAAKEEGEETSIRFAEAVADMSAGAADKIKALAYCDSLYYGHAKALAVEAIDEVITGQIQQAVDKGLYTQPYSFLPALSISAKAGTKKKERKSTTTTDYTGIINDIIAGKYIVSYDWDDESKKAIPSMDYFNTYIPDEHFIFVLQKIYKRLQKAVSSIDIGVDYTKILKETASNLLLVGKPGTGKTAMFYALGAALGVPVYSENMSKNTEEGVFQGLTTIVDGHPEFVLTDFCHASDKGGIVICEEINLPDPSVIMGSLSQFAVFPYTTMRNGYETVRRHPLCILGAAMNVGTAGSKPLNEALSNRFETLVLEDPSPEQFKKILAASGKYKASNIDYVYDAYTKVVSFLKDEAEEMTMRLSIRSCLNALEDMEEFDCPPKTAIYNAFVAKIAEADLEIAKKLDSLVIRILGTPKA